MASNSLTNNDLADLSTPTKDFVRNFNLFMKNKLKSQKPQVNVTNVLTSNYENWTLGQRGKNKAKQTQLPKRKNATKHLFKKDLYKFRPFELFKNKAKQTQFDNCRRKTPMSAQNICQPPNALKIDGKINTLLTGDGFLGIITVFTPAEPTLIVYTYDNRMIFLAYRRL